MPLRSLTMQCLDGARPFFAFTRRYQQYRTVPKHSTAYPMLHVQSITDTSRSLHCPYFASPNHSPQLLDCSEHINAYTGHCGTLPMRDPTIPCRQRDDALPNPNQTSLFFALTPRNSTLPLPRLALPCRYCKMLHPTQPILDIARPTLLIAINAQTVRGNSSTSLVGTNHCRYATLPICTQPLPLLDGTMLCLNEATLCQNRS